MDDITFLKDILSGSNVDVNISNNLDRLLEIIPELKEEIGFDQKHPHHHLDVWNHTLLALSLSDDDFDIRLSLLLHDIGKPHSYQENNGIRHFYNHPKVGAEISEGILKRLNFSDEYISKISYLILNHDTPITKNDIIFNRDITLKRYEIQRCDALAHNPDKLEKRKNYLEKVKIMLYN